MDSQATGHKQLQGPKPASLMVNRNSSKIKKQQHLSPLIVHLRSPKVIHVKPEEFMGLVQQLTGKPVSASSMENGSTVTTTMDENSIEDFIGSAGHTAISVDFQDLMQFLHFV
ncbi:VQ motif-containing protein 8, chloroplastic [Cajanus cajan]|uniref:VQ domain-containing protein n=1 Tax=Cajanus cajan TaxID=3821 RepID=A0A151SQB1_CAJCA|nr:VQ motif-containing protein 8, chloroplastic [Cajanus cajan]KYP56983.1 hypothetical protein KK1_003234 [Cajanus cajan]